ncbi:MAG: ABC transporter permease [Flavobacteriaceae bacterium]|nr:ABC transporter permease [Flavobacteriaceae bacterium]
MKNISWYIAFRYFISKKSTQTVSIIMYASIIAIAFVTCAMFVILSIFSGLEKFNIRLLSDVNPDLKISASEGKTLPNLANVEKILRSQTETQSYSKVIEEKVYVIFDKKDEIAYLKGVDENFLNVVKIDTCFQAGKFPHFSSDDQAAFGTALAYRLGLAIDSTIYCSLYMPKPGKGLITSRDEAFTKTEVTMTGVFSLNEQYESYVFVPIQISQKLLNLPTESAFTIEVKLKNRNEANAVQKTLQTKLGSKYQVLTRQQQDASFLKMMKVEQLFIYLIFILFIIISSFNLAGAIIIIIIDKKLQNMSLLSLGYSLKKLKNLFFTVGLIISVSGIFIGILMGAFLTQMQESYGWVMANAIMPFPVEFNVSNYIIVVAPVLIISVLVSYISSRRLNF